MIGDRHVCGYARNAILVMSCRISDEPDLLERLDIWEKDLEFVDSIILKLQAAKLSHVRRSPVRLCIYLFVCFAGMCFCSTGEANRG